MSNNFNEKTAKEFYQGRFVKWKECVEGKLARINWNCRFKIAIGILIGFLLGLIL